MNVLLNKMFAQEDSNLKTIACFSCSDLDSVSLLNSGYFQELLNFEVNFSSDPAVELCGNQTASFSVFNNIQQSFMKIKQNFYLVKDSYMRHFDRFKEKSDFCNVKVLRMDILKIFHILLANIKKLNSNYLQHYSSDNSHLRNIVMQLASEIKHLLIYVGSISSIPDIITVSDFSSISTCRGAFNVYHFLHLCLDIWYNCLIILYALHFSVPIDFKETFCDFAEQTNAFLQVASFLIYDLSSLSINNYINFHGQKDSPFLCSCVKDFWIMLIKLCDNFNSKNGEHMFWDIFFADLQIFLKKTSHGVQDLSIDKFSAQNINACSDTYKLIESCFWLTLHIAPLYKYDVFGHFCEYENSKGGFVVSKYLIQSLLSDSLVSEKYLCSCLVYCIELSKMWETNAEILFPLTDFYLKKIDKSFSVQDVSFSYLFKDSKSWFVYVDNLSNCVTSGKETSFDYFLIILSLQLRLDKESSLWRSLKGRIYSKFTPKKIKELSEVGLQNTFSFLQIIVLSEKLEIIEKVCEACSIIEALANPRKQLISWKALFALLYINQVRKYDSRQITELLSKFFDLTCSDYSKISSDSIFRNNLMNVLLVYIDNMNALFKKSDGFSLSTYPLISSGFSVLLKFCSLSDQNYILGVILNILLSIQRMTELNETDYVVNNTECVRALQLIFDNVYPFIEQVATVETGLSAVSDIAKSLTKLTFTFASALNSSAFDFYKIFMFFASNDNVSSYITCNYLSCILDHSEITQEIRLRSNNLDIILLQSWLKCLIDIQTKNDKLHGLTKKVFLLPVIKEIVPGFEISFESEDPIEITRHFFKTVGNAFAHHNMSEKIVQARKVQSFFKNYGLLAANKIHEGKNALTFAHVYKLTSLLIEHCSPVLHFRVSSESLLLQILDSSVYPQILFPKDKTLQNLASFAIKEHLSSFLRGLFKLEYRRDKSIEREIRNIFIFYVGVFPVSNNPLIKLFIDSFHQHSGGLDLDAWLFILETPKLSFLSNSVENPQSIFQFYQEIFKLASPEHKEDIANIILKCTMEFFMRQKESITELKVLIKKVLFYFKDKCELSQSKLFLKPIIMWFVQEKLQWSIARGFCILDLFVDIVPQVMLDLIGFFNESIETLEKSRGFGEDKFLRNEFQNYIAKLRAKFNES